MEETMKRIKELFCERLNVKEIDMKTDLASLGLDSLDVVEMCYAVEEEAGIRFETEELSSFVTVGDLFDSIEKKIAAKK
ncbi:MAG: acyl carrier protein [Bacilli bacterium]|nr:acyl carrier protein [Bacilli bacterium]MBQ4255758.1 acyl carrier protein [Bacilli bacterium]